MNSSSSKLVSLSGFKFFKCAFDEMSSLPFPPRLGENICGELTFIGDISTEFLLWSLLFPIGFSLLSKYRTCSVADPDPGLGAFLTPGSGIRDGRKSASGSGIRDPE
jgi:hypothetical protein